MQMRFNSQLFRSLDEMKKEIIFRNGRARNALSSVQFVIGTMLWVKITVKRLAKSKQLIKIKI